MRNAWIDGHAVVVHCNKCYHRGPLLVAVLLKALLASHCLFVFDVSFVSSDLFKFQIYLLASSKDIRFFCGWAAFSRYARKLLFGRAVGSKALTG